MKRLTHPTHFDFFFVKTFFYWTETWADSVNKIFEEFYRLIIFSIHTTLRNHHYYHGHYNNVMNENNNFLMFYSRNYTRRWSSNNVERGTKFLFFFLNRQWNVIRFCDKYTFTAFIKSVVQYLCVYQHRVNKNFIFLFIIIRLQSFFFFC